MEREVGPEPGAPPRAPSPGLPPPPAARPRARMQGAGADCARLRERRRGGGGEGASPAYRGQLECRGRRSGARQPQGGGGPAPLRLRPRRGSPAARSPPGALGRAAGAADRGLCASGPGRAQGPQTPASAAGGRLRQGGETQKKGGKKKGLRAEGEKLIFSPIFFRG